MTLGPAPSRRRRAARRAVLGEQHRRPCGAQARRGPAGQLVEHVGQLHSSDVSSVGVGDRLERLLGPHEGPLAPAALDDLADQQDAQESQRPRRGSRTARTLAEGMTSAP